MDQVKKTKIRKESEREPLTQVTDDFVSSGSAVEPFREGISTVASEESVAMTRAERIRERAYAIWLAHGQSHGRDQEQWREAENDIDEEERS